MFFLRSLTYTWMQQKMLTDIRKIRKAKAGIWEERNKIYSA